MGGPTTSNKKQLCVSRRPLRVIIRAAIALRMMSVAGAQGRARKGAWATASEVGQGRSFLLVCRTMFLVTWIPV